MGKTIITAAGETVVNEAVARAIYKYLVKNDYINEDDTVSAAYVAARGAGTEAVPTSEELKPMIDAVLPARRRCLSQYPSRLRTVVNRR